MPFPVQSERVRRVGGGCIESFEARFSSKPPGATRKFLFPWIQDSSKEPDIPQTPIRDLVLTTVPGGNRSCFATPTYAARLHEKTICFRCIFDFPDGPRPRFIKLRSRRSDSRLPPPPIMPFSSAMSRCQNSPSMVEWRIPYFKSSESSGRTQKDRATNARPYGIISFQGPGLFLTSSPRPIAFLSIPFIGTPRIVEIGNPGG